MTYKLNPAIAKVKSPVILVYPENRREEYRSGEDAAEAVFEERYEIREIRAVHDKIEVRLNTLQSVNSSWCNEKEASFF
ncbi:MAG: hypothetical protein IKF90_20940 [Parasporobacterium sp.]|nr:hypothetical protein [Parasporobacterium sp.]